MAGSTPSFNHRYIYLLGIFYGFSQEVSTMALAISFKDEMAIKITISQQMVACDKQKTALVCFSFFKDEMAIKITISQQMVACDKQKTALVCFWSVKYHTRAFLGRERHETALDV
jgi:hypothetical protein